MSLKKTQVVPYAEFDTIDGSHPYKDLGSEFFVEYPVFNLKKGKIAYFNFDLAKDMGLLGKDHKQKLNAQLEKKILDTFAIQIINEYDVLTKKRIPSHLIKPNKYMATRYLQLQHKNKKGKTSGDGRSIWNGQYKNGKTVWDVSSRGTGVTCLSPGSADSNKPLKTGNTDTGYGCGQAEIDELVSCAIMSEVVHKMGIYTERVLTVIDLGNGLGIGVRAAESLLRPAHAYLFLKQNRWEPLKKVIDYAVAMKKYSPRALLSAKQDKYDLFLNDFCDRFATFAAQLEEHYLFVWLDWDGDNVLMEAGIIDYGSVRHFGSCHNQYRYDDVERFSTNLLEQKGKAKAIVMTMIQAIDFVKTRSKKNLDSFRKHPQMARFEKKFNEKRLYFFAQKIGISDTEFAQINANSELNRALIKLFKACHYWENLKTQSAFSNVADGINKNPLCNMRNFYREYPTFKTYSKNSKLTIDEFVSMTWTQSSPKKSTNLFYKNSDRFEDLLTCYDRVVASLSRTMDSDAYLTMAKNAGRWNPSNFLTGNALIHTVDHILQQYAIDAREDLVQQIVEKIVSYVSGEASSVKRKSMYDVNSNQSKEKIHQKLWDQILMNLHEYRDEF
ncbi:MAG: YdiU family protein [Bdellovibrionaceae bacterium]|nr:YdiU family protein [Pseudobdellovibrionaceae bacterium]